MCVCGFVFCDVFLDKLWGIIIIEEVCDYLDEIFKCGCF